MGRLPRREGFAVREAGLLLRPLRPTDAGAVYRACQDPLIQRWTSVPSPYQREHAVAFTGQAAAQWWDDEVAAHLGVFEPDTGQLLGCAGLVDLDLARRAAEVGFWTAPWARGLGIAERAARAVARWALADLGVCRLGWRAEVGNHASRLVALKVGFELEGILRSRTVRRGGRRVDDWVGSLLPGQLREAGASMDPVVRLRAAAFGRPQPRLAAVTPAGATLTLRAPAAADLDATVAACRDPESMRWTSLPDSYDRASAELFVHEYAPGRWARGDGAVFAIADADDGYAGSMELRLLAPSISLVASTRIADVGYLVAPWARGRGYASSALRRMSEWGLADLGLHRIEWRATVGNDASQRAARKAGFRMEGVARAGIVARGEMRDTWTGALLATDLATNATTASDPGTAAGDPPERGPRPEGDHARSPRR